MMSVQRKRRLRVGDFEGKVALVTGAGQGIGQATARAFAREGAMVACADVNENAGADTARAIVDQGGAAEFFRCDVAKEQEVGGLLEAVNRRFGRLDIAHNNAGVEGDHVSVEKITYSDWQRVIGVNLTGVWLCMRAEIDVMREHGGAIINTSSASGLIGGANLAAYTASKHGVVGLTKAAAVDLATSGIRVNAVCPGAIDTPFIADLPPEIHELILRSTPAGRFGHVNEIADAVLWLASDRASYVLGTCISVDGGVVAI
jgi:NAD(P)-dependent dehydrogenase (short-subunit alcohol dehydrogenase family)